MEESEACGGGWADSWELHERYLSCIMGEAGVINGRPNRKSCQSWTAAAKGIKCVAGAEERSLNMTKLMGC